MNTSKLADIIQQVERYMRGKLSRAEYRAWLIDEVWNADSLGDAELESILYDLEALDAEFTSGVWSEDELKSELRERILSTRANRASG
jgi:hypothetical protein